MDWDDMPYQSLRRGKTVVVNADATRCPGFHLFDDRSLNILYESNVLYMAWRLKYALPVDQQSINE